MKIEDLIPVIVQDASTQRVLMLGYMNQEALEQTQKTGWVTFYSRSKQRLWLKGETSGHQLKLLNLCLDCDQDALLAVVQPMGPTCHTGDLSCFKDAPTSDLSFLQQLENLIQDRRSHPKPESYTSRLLAQGISRLAQKVGEEALEVALAATSETCEKLSEEVADLLFHVLVLLSAKGLTLNQIIRVLKERN